jgi:hypothetical protein
VGDLRWNKDYEKKCREGVKEAKDTTNLLLCGPDQTQDIAFMAVSSVALNCEMHFT